MTETSTLELTRFGGPIVYDPIQRRAECAVVFLDGIQSSRVTPGSTISGVLMEFGDHIAVQYPESFGFGGKKAARQILEHIQHYKTVVFVGLSLGGLLAYDIIALAKRRKLEIDFRLMLLSTPTGVHDLKNPLAKWARFIPPVYLPKIVNKKLLFGGPFPDHADDLTEDEHQELEEHERYSREYPFGPWIRQVAFIVAHPELDEEVLEGVRTVYLRTPEDPYVRRRAFTSWSRAYTDGPLPEVVVPLKGSHCNLVAYPRTWAHAIRHGFGHLGLGPIES